MTTCSLGLDIGSVTVKLALTGADGRILAAHYLRHGAAAREALLAALKKLAAAWPGLRVRAAMTGSGALELAERLRVPFVQEVVAAARAIARVAPQTDVAVELGGEDAKILYLDQSVELRMNEVCAGGTGAFIDHMAALLHTDAAGLNDLAAQATTIYPIASRCGVFAKTDIVPLLNQRARKSDIAASIFQAVVEQTIGGLACGRPIQGHVAFAGGPLHFLSELKKRFVTTLGLQPEHVVTLPDGQYMVALGAALCAAAEARPDVPLEALAEALRRFSRAAPGMAATLAPLFADEESLRRFRRRHALCAFPRREAREAVGPVYLGVDLGSTTVKAALMDDDGALLASWYGRNEGDPLKKLIPAVMALLEALPPNLPVRGAATGYGAQMAEAALGLDFTEVETVAHLQAARALVPDLSYVVDIGGQDMKCLKVREGSIAGVTLNEACSAGCGAFLETFAQSLGLDMESFVRLALSAARPADLGSRCTVFMNSKVKQAQKDGARIADIAAGLCYAVVRNALHKVLRLRHPAELGPRVLVQGGAFLNDALLRAMELLLERDVIRPRDAGLMGACGAALLARRRAGEHAGRSPAAMVEELRRLRVTVRDARCAGCGNACRLTVNTFSHGRRLISGNRCERGAAPDPGRPLPPNIYAWKYQRLFDYAPLPPEQAPRGRLGLPRALGMYEHYPFWFTLFTRLGYRVELSPPTDRQTLLLGLDSLPSQTVCYPAKLAHGHVAALLSRGVRTIFFPCLPRERRESPQADDCYNCPVVCGYPDVVRLNTSALRQQGGRLHTPFVQPAHIPSLVRTLCREFALPAREVRRAAEAAHRELATYRAALRAEGERILTWVEATGAPGMVLAGRPYHADPAVHHGLPECIASLGAAVLSEDCLAHLDTADGPPLRVQDQWAFHSRLYRAASVAIRHPGLELVQLTSFGCGLDAITSDQLEERLHGAGKLHTVLKIDEGASLGSARIRIRSLMAAVRERRIAPRPAPVERPPAARPRISAAESRTLLVPQMSPLHFPLVAAAMNSVGHRVRVLEHVRRADIETGLELVHNDACYPALVIIGQLVEALRNGQADAAATGVLLAQTCGPCRASNYAALLRKALAECGLDHVPVLTMGSGPAGRETRLPVSPTLLHRATMGCLYGDMLQRLSMASRTRELHAGDTEDRLRHWLSRAEASVARGDTGQFRADMPRMVRDFAAIPQDFTPRPRVGLVGEILLKYHPFANNGIAASIRREGGEPLLTDLTDFFLYCLRDDIFEWRHLGGSRWTALTHWLLIRHVERLRDAMRAALAEAPGGWRSLPVTPIVERERCARAVISPGHRAGEGWLLTADMLEFAASGVDNVLCLQPFGCLPNHITGKGVIRETRRRYPKANIMAVDFDPGSSETNQANRIKLFMSFARHEE